MNFNDEELNRLEGPDGFRLRGLDMTRLETFMDAAFAFSITMLVISLDKMPGNYSELMVSLKGIPAFAASFALMMAFWISHRKWSRYYGMEDGVSIFLSLMLIFVLLVYIYPLKLVLSAFFSWISGGWLPSQFVLRARGELVGLFVIYGFGAFAMGGLMGLLYIRARKAKERLRLNTLELIRTNEEIVGWFVMAATGAVSALFALLMPERIAIYAGFVYSWLAIVAPYIGIHYGKKIKKIQNDARELVSPDSPPMSPPSE